MKRREFVNLSVTATGMAALSPVLSGAKKVMNPEIHADGTTDDYSKWKYSQGFILNTAATGAAVQSDVHNIAIPLRFNLNTVLMTGASQNGADLRFAKIDGTPLPYQIERWDWNDKAKRAEVWVLMDVIKGNTRAEAFRMYWGNPSVKDVNDGNKVFETSKGFLGVWHLNEKGNTSPGGYHDSSGNGAHGTGVNLTENSSSEGVIAGAQDFQAGHATGEGAFIRIDPAKKQLFSVKSEVTISVWVKIEKWQNFFETFVSKGDHEWRLSRILRTDTMEFCLNGYEPNGVGGKVGIADGKWHHVVGTCTGKSMDLYVDGKLDQANPIIKGGPSPTEYDVLIGANSEQPWRNFCGMIDEGMVLGEGRDADWVKMIYESQREDQTLVTPTRPVPKK